MSLLRPRRKLPWPALAERIAVATTERFPAVAFRTSGPDEVPAVRWADGPSSASVQEALGDDAPGWTWVLVAPGGSPPEAAVADAVAASVLPDGARHTSVVWAVRSWSTRAVATALVRFYGMRGRYFTESDDRHRDAFMAVLDVDDPARSGYPIVDTVTDLLLERADPPLDADAPEDVDVVSAALRALGYEALWNVAFSRTS